MNETLHLSEKRAVASRVPSEEAVLRIWLEGPQVGSWALEHQNDELMPLGLYVAGGGPEFTVNVIGRRSVGPAYLAGHLELGLVVDSGEFANNFEAIQIAVERLAELPDADHLARASLRVEAEQRA